MALKPLAELEDFELVHSEQDCRGWTVVDAAGQQIGTVREMLVDTEAERVTALILDSGAQIPARAVSFQDRRVIIGDMQGNDVAAGMSDNAEQDRVFMRSSRGTSGSASARSKAAAFGSRRTFKKSRCRNR